MKRASHGPEANPPRVIHGDATTRHAFNEIVRGLATIGALAEADESSVAAAHECVVDIEEALQALGVTMLRHLDGTRQSTPLIAALEAARDIVSDARDAFSLGDDPPADFESGQRWIHEIGLESADAAVVVSPEPHTGLAVEWRSLTAMASHAWLLSHVYRFLDASIDFNSLLALERRASWWNFMRFSTPLERRGVASFSQMHREQEWSLIERITLSTGASVLADAIRANSFDSRRPRQRKLSKALRQSLRGGF